MIELIFGGLENFLINSEGHIFIYLSNLMHNSNKNNIVLGALKSTQKGVSAHSAPPINLTINNFLYRQKIDFLIHYILIHSATQQPLS